MCGRYESMIDDDEIAYVLEREEKGRAEKYLNKKEVFPGTEMPVLYGAYSGVRSRLSRWGYKMRTPASASIASPGTAPAKAQKSAAATRDIINARAETALAKPLFRGSTRIVVPSSGYFEWNNHTKYHIGGSVLLMAGLSREEDPRAIPSPPDAPAAEPVTGRDAQSSYVILTTASLGSLAWLHPRMPVFLTHDELEPWLYDDEFAKWRLAATRAPELPVVPC